MRTALSIGMVAFLAACAGAAPRPQGEEATSGRWQGFLLRNGLREPVAVDLTYASSAWDGRLSAGDNSVPLEGVRVSGNNVHFELPGEGVFDGAVAGNSMAGSVSGPTSGSFSLMRIDQTNAAWKPDFILGP
jgi:hypothetical protein